MRLAKLIFAGIAVLGLTPVCFAQNCALCYTTASQLGAGAQHALDFGILALLTPALALFAGVFLLLYRRVVAASA